MISLSGHFLSIAHVQGPIVISRLDDGATAVVVTVGIDSVVSEYVFRLAIKADVDFGKELNTDLALVSAELNIRTRKRNMTYEVVVKL